MTANQIAYSQAQETKRHNLMMEQIDMGKLLVSTAEAYTHQKVGDAQSTKYAADAYYEINKVAVEQNQLLINAMDAFTRASVGESTIEKNKADAYKSLQDVQISWYNAETNRLNAQSQRLQANASLFNAETARSSYLLEKLYRPVEIDLQLAGLQRKDRELAAQEERNRIGWDANQVQRISAALGVLGSVVKIATGSLVGLLG